MLLLTIKKLITRGLIMNRKISVKLFSASNYLLYFFISILLIVSLIFIDKFIHFYDLTNTRKFTIGEESSKF